MKGGSVQVFGHERGIYAAELHEALEKGQYGRGDIAVGGIVGLASVLGPVGQYLGQRVPVGAGLGGELLLELGAADRVEPEFHLQRDKIPIPVSHLEKEPGQPLSGLFEAVR